MGTLKLTLGCVLLAVTAQVSADEYWITGTIDRLDTIDDEITEVDFGATKIRLNSTETAGDCLIANDQVVMWIRDNSMGERMYTAALAAKLGGHTVTLRVDDDYKDSFNVCYLQQLRFE